MKKIIPTILLIGASSLFLGACTSTDVDTTTGGIAGAGLGYVATGGSAVGTLIGAGTGAFIGNQVSYDQNRRYYYRNGYYRDGYNHGRYYRNGYYRRGYYYN